jgi:hypothetical protein
MKGEIDHAWDVRTRQVPEQEIAWDIMLRALVIGDFAGRVTVRRTKKQPENIIESYIISIRSDCTMRH